MRTHTRALQASIAVVNFLIFLLAFTSIYPFPSGDFSVDLPSPSEVEWEYDSGVVTITAPFSIDNGGFYDVDGLTISYEVSNFSGAPIAGDSLDLGSVKAGAVTESELVFSIDLMELFEEGMTWMVFNDDLLDFVVEVSCFYTLKLVKFDATYSVSIPWDALIREIAVDGYLYDPDTGRLLVDYHMATSSILSGSSVLTASMYEDGSLVSETSGTVQLGRYHSDTLVFELPAGSVPDTITLSAVVAGFPVEQSHTIPSGVLP